jgi:hypothetical protein
MIMGIHCVDLEEKHECCGRVASDDFDQGGRLSGQEGP